MMDSRLIAIILTVWICLICGIKSQAGVGQGQTPIGAYRIFPKTTFSCVGRPSGYYADIQTGCQVYHMCDGLGRQFSYSCPNTTLFQQRMLICDHWYMVNCSKAESDYTANLLIGQRDKPFVPEEENHLRTPRPDLLDRPYAPDYSGESFRNQFSIFPQITNQISDSEDEEGTRKNSNIPTRWSIVHDKNDAVHKRRTTSRPIVVEDPEENHLVNNRRIDDVDENTSVDLGTSYSSHYNTSADISNEQNDSDRVNSLNDVVVQSEKKPVKKPSVIYEPPFFQPIYNENYTASTTTTTKAPLTTTIQFRTTRAPQTTATTLATTTTTQRIIRRPATFSPRPFAPPIAVSTTPLAPTLPIRPDNTESTKHSNGPQPSQQFIQPTIFRTKKFGASQPESRNSISDPSAVLDFDLAKKTNQFLSPPPVSQSAIINNLNIPKPSQDILPPYPEYIQHDVATTQGPPIYYEWKAPSNSLQPPKFDPPISVYGKRVDPDYNNPNKTVKTSSTISPNLDDSRITFRFLNNPFLSSLFTRNQNGASATKSPTPRSIQQSPSPTNSVRTNDSQATNKVATVAQPTETNFQALQRQFLIPDFLFPLENEGRTGYEHRDTLNSFQLKIPQRRNDNKPWYGENPQCPECHPSYVKPGTCQPCIQRHR